MQDKKYKGKRRDPGSGPVLNPVLNSFQDQFSIRDDNGA